MKIPTVTVSFPAHVPCADKYCPLKAEYGSHTHTLYNAYELTQDDYRPNIDETAASLVAVSVFPHEIAPVASTVKGFQNV